MKMGIIGYGGMAHWHKDIINRIEGLKIAGIWDISEKARSIAQEEGLLVYKSLEDMLSDKELTFVLIATDNDVHASLAIKAMEHGKHVVCEKPITLSSALLDEMIAVSEKTSRLLTVHQNRRWDNDFLTAKRIIENNELGEVFKFESRVHGSRGISDTWRRKKEKGGGVIYDWGIHLFDQLLQIKKGVSIKSVYATSQNITTEFVEDGFTAHILFHDGTKVLIQVETSDFIGSPRWRIFGNNGTAEIYTWDGKGTIIKACGTEDNIVPLITASGYTKTMAPRTDDTITKYDIIPEPGDIKEFYKNVMSTILEQEESVISFKEIRNAVRLLESVFKSIEQNQAVDCALIL